MKSLDRYIFQHLFTSFVMVSLGLCCVLWLTQSLRFVEMIVNRGLGVGMFVYFTGLLLPNFLSIILPIALFAVVIFTYSRLNLDRELPVMRACGMSNWAIAKPALALCCLVIGLAYLLNFYMVPRSYELFRNLQWELRSNLSHLLLREGAFNDLGDDVTVYIRERSQEGQLLGVLVHDESDPQNPTTLMAKRGALVDVNGAARVILFEGNRQVMNTDDQKLSMLYFDRYTHALDLKGPNESGRVPKAKELGIAELLDVRNNPNIPAHDHDKFIVEAHQRIISPFLSLNNTLIALLFLVSGQFSRRGQTRRIISAAGCVILLQAASLGMVNSVSKNIDLLPVMYLVTLAPLPLCCFFLNRHPKTNPKRMKKERALAQTLHQQGQQEQGS